MDEKGFTLIELLSVIVILAIIALIVSPVVTGIILKTKLSADMRSAEGYVKAAEDYYAHAQIDENKKTNINSNVIDDLEIYSNNRNGYVVVDDDGKVNMAIIINDKCYIKNKDSNAVEVLEDTDNCSVFTVPPDRCFDTSENEDGTLTITKYKCGESFSYDAENETAKYNDDGEFVNISIPSMINNKKVTSLADLAFVPLNMENGEVDETARVGIKNIDIPNCIKKFIYCFIYSGFDNMYISSSIILSPASLGSKSIISLIGGKHNVIIKNEVMQIPPEGCFDTSENEDGTLTITKYKCGNSLKTFDNESRAHDYNDDGEYTDIIIPKKINDKIISAIGTFAFSPMKDKVTPDYSVKTGIHSLKIDSENLKISDSAFLENQIKSLEINSENLSLESMSLAQVTLLDVRLYVKNLNIAYKTFGRGGGMIYNMYLYNNVTLNQVNCGFHGINSFFTNINVEGNCFM